MGLGEQIKRARRLIVGFSFFGVLVGGAPTTALAAGAPPIHLVLRDCDDFRECEVERVVSAELATNAAVDDDAPDPTWIVGTCEHQRVQIEVTDAVSRKTVRRSFLLTAAAPEARSRLVGIAASELVLASWAELAQRPQLRVEPEGPRPSPERAAAAAERARANAAKPPQTGEPVPIETSEEPKDAETPAEGAAARPARTSLFTLRPTNERNLRVVPMGSLRRLDAGNLYGGGLRVGEEPLLLTSWALDTLFETGHVDTYSGRFEIDTWTLGAMLFLYGREGMFTARVGAGLRAGLSISHGDLGATTSAMLPWGWPMLALSMSLGGNGVVAELAGEGGYASLPLAPSSTGLSVSGFWVAAQLGFGFSR